MDSSFDLFETSSEEDEEEVEEDESILDLEPISEAEQSSFCVEMMKRLNMQRRQNYLCDITLVAKAKPKRQAILFQYCCINLISNDSS